jgi:mannose-6-phosphate isomerase
MQTVFPLQGVVQHYDWGGYRVIPELLGNRNDDNRPYAELWMGAHPKGPALVQWEDGALPLDEAIHRQGLYLMGPSVYERFEGKLPFLLKLLDVRKMLSIQAHPTLAQAREGYDREEALGIPLEAAHRNYRDRNHKPESMVALTDFWLLHGFRPLSEIEASLEAEPAWHELKPVLAQEGLPGLYARVMRAPQQEVDRWLAPLRARLTSPDGYPKSSPHHWAARAFEDYTHEGRFDRGIFSIYWFNLVFLRPGEGVFQAAGLPHAYLEGANVELMANSDNVLRGGLTPKHIDAEELLDKVRAEPVVPEILRGRDLGQGRSRYPAPIDDYVFDRIQLAPGAQWEGSWPGPLVAFIYSGAAVVNGQVFRSGQAFFAIAGATIAIAAAADVPLDLYCAACA